MGTPDPGRDRSTPPSAGAEGFVWAAIGALYASVVTAVVVAVLDTDLGRELAKDLDAPVRALIAVPVLGLAAIVFVASVLALSLPAIRSRMLRVAGLAGWLIPAWLVIAAVLIASVVYVVGRLE